MLYSPGKSEPEWTEEFFQGNLEAVSWSGIIIWLLTKASRQNTHQFCFSLILIKALTRKEKGDVTSSSKTPHVKLGKEKPSEGAGMSHIGGGLLSFLGCKEAVKSMDIEMSMLPVGSRVVKVEGPRSCLSQEGSEKETKGFLIPMSSLDSHEEGEIVLNDNSKLAKFLRIKEKKEGFQRDMSFPTMGDMD